MPCIQKGIKMEEKEIRKYAVLMQELNLTALEISESGSSLRLERTAQANSPAPLKPEPAASDNEPSENVNFCSPMVGVFYRAPAENSAPFVEVGDIVHKGDVLCIIEAMKLMNEIVADHSGTIAEICVGNSQVVDFGQVLFRLRKDSK